MADFVKFGNGAAGMAASVAGNADRAGIADFLVIQEKLLQDEAIKARLEGAKPGGAGGSPGGGKTSDPSVTGEAAGALQRLQAMLAKSGGRR